jgi:Flp pilus assembly protein CpaB
MWDLSKSQTTSFPFAAVDIPVATPITDDLIEWMPMPEGAIPVPVLSGASAATNIGTGDPLTRSVLSRTEPLPPGWWSIPIDIPARVPVGASIRVVLPDGTAATGIVTQPAGSDSLGVPSPGSVGFPEATADIVAQLASTGRLIILVEP